MYTSIRKRLSVLLRSAVNYYISWIWYVLGSREKPMRNIVWPSSLNLHYFPSCDIPSKCLRRLWAVFCLHLNYPKGGFHRSWCIIMVPGRHTVYCKQRVTRQGHLTKAPPIRGRRKRKAAWGGLPAMADPPLYRSPRFRFGRFQKQNKVLPLLKSFFYLKTS